MQNAEDGTGVVINSKRFQEVATISVCCVSNAVLQFRRLAISFLAADLSGFHSTVALTGA